jgi:prepilin-type N-terminal cleavage/methylation domain-containing protein
MPAAPFEGERVRKQHGYSFVELLVVMAILAIVVGAASAAFAGMRNRSAVRAASQAMRSIFHLARARAIASGVNCGVRFEQTRGEWQFSLYDDGDGDGVRTEDIRKGIDRRVSPPRVVMPESKLVSIGLLRQTIRDPDGDKLTASKSPVQFGRSSICSFSPLGESTPGTIYVVSRAKDLFAVRVYGASAKMRVLRYEPSRQKWVP